MPADPELLRQAQATYRLCASAPQEAHDKALDIASRADGNPLARIAAMRTMGRALRILEGPTAAARVLREAIALGERLGLAEPLAEARITYAANLADLGRVDEALAECDKAAAVLRGADAGPLLAQKALVLCRAGRTDEAFVLFARALHLLRVRNDVDFQCLVRMNRANLHAYLGRLGEAERDLRTGLALAEKYSLRHIGQQIAGNLGFIALRRGDIPTALRLLDEAVRGAPQYMRFTLTRDRAETLLMCGLAEEARSCLEEVIGDVGKAGFAVDIAEWHMLLAHAALIEGDATAAYAFARQATSEFRQQKRAGWAKLSRHLEIRARWTGGERTAVLARAARNAATELTTAGWQVAAMHCQLVAGRIELDSGRVARARTDLTNAAKARRRGPADLRAAAWYAEALLRRAGGDVRKVTAALRAGLRVIDEHAATLGATDLRVHASGLGNDLAIEGVRLAIASGRPSAVLEWSERLRAAALRRRPARPPADHKLAADLAELRRITAELAHATAAGEDSRTLRSKQMRIEEKIRLRSRHASGDRGKPRPLNVAELSAALGERVLVEFLRANDTLLAITSNNGRLELHVLGSYGATLKELESLRFSLHRLARRHGSRASLDAAATTVRHAATNLEKLLLYPLRERIGESELVIVPTGELHALPWPTLPILRGRPVCAAPSATSWLTAMRTTTHNNDDVVLVAGPNLEHANTEIRLLAKLYETPAILTGKKARADAVRKVMDGAGLVHIAAHGKFRADNPQFSAIELADGPLTVYDLERLRHAPHRIVLSACDSGLSAVHPGDELMGLVAALFSLGTSTLIASVVPVADDVTKAMMLELHRALRAGTSPSGALATAQERVRSDGFVCFGAS